MTKETSGLIYKLFNILCFVIIGLVNKYAMQALSAFQTFFLTCSSMIIVLAIFIKLTSKASLISYIKEIDRTFFYLALTTFISLSTFIYALQLIDMVTVSAISYLTPVVMSLLGVFILKEKFSTNIAISLTTSIMGTILIILPSMNSSLHIRGIASAITSAIFWAIYDLLLKKQSKIHWAKQSFMLLLFCIPISMPFAIATWQPLTITHLKFLSILGILYSINKMLLIKALAHTRLILLAPIIYTKLIFAAIFSYFLFSEVIQLNTIIGSALIVFATIGVMYHGKQSKTNA